MTGKHLPRSIRNALLSARVVRIAAAFATVWILACAAEILAAESACPVLPTAAAPGFESQLEEYVRLSRALAADASCTFGATGLSSVNPPLDPDGLEKNDGLTETIALKANPAVINAATFVDCPATARRGDARSAGANSCDAGALQYGAASPPHTANDDEPVCDPPPANLVSWWPGNVDASDIVGHYSGTPTGGVSFTPGEVRNAFTFDGSSGYLNFVNFVDDLSFQVSSGDFTVDMWVKFNSLASRSNNCFGPNGDCDASILEKMDDDDLNHDGWRVIKQADDHIWFCFGGGSVNGCDPAGPTTVRSNAAVTTGLFYHIAAVKQAVETNSGPVTTISLYVDGVPDGSTTMRAFTDSGVSDMFAGGRSVASSDSGAVAFLDGQLDEIELFNRALSQAEINKIYLAGSAGKCKAAPTATAAATGTAAATLYATPTATSTPVGLRKLSILKTHTAPTVTQGSTGTYSTESFAVVASHFNGRRRISRNCPRELSAAILSAHLNPVHHTALDPAEAWDELEKLSGLERPQGAARLLGHLSYRQEAAVGIEEFCRITKCHTCDLCE